MEVLIIDDGTDKTSVNDRYWSKWLDKCRGDNLPDYIFVAAAPQELVLDEGLQSKGWRQRYLRWGYEAHFWFLRSHEHGGVVQQD